MTPWTAACQAPLSMGFSRQKYWSGLPFPPPGDPIIFYHSLLLVPSIFPNIRVFSNELTLCSPMDCSLSGSPVHGILQAKVLEWVASAFSVSYPSLWTLHAHAFTSSWHSGSILIAVVPGESERSLIQKSQSLHKCKESKQRLFPH